MKSKIKSLFDTGDMLSPGRSRNTTGAKAAAVDESALALEKVWLTEECRYNK
jgi:hypothetical protein